jgi:hypothetical protein
MYNYPTEGIRNYATAPKPTLLTLIESQLSWFDETTYLSPVTRALCDDIVLRSKITYDLTKILPGIEQPHTQVYKELRVGLFQFEQAGGVVEELQPPIGSLSTIEEMVQRFQSEESSTDIRGDSLGNILGEVEVDLSDEDKAEINTDDVEFNDDGLFFEP